MNPLFLKDNKAPPPPQKSLTLYPTRYNIFPWENTMPESNANLIEKKISIECECWKFISLQYSVENPNRAKSIFLPIESLFLSLGEITRNENILLYKFHLFRDVSHVPGVWWFSHQNFPREGVWMIAQFPAVQFALLKVFRRKKMELTLIFSSFPFALCEKTFIQQCLRQ